MDISFVFAAARGNEKNLCLAGDPKEDIFVRQFNEAINKGKGLPKHFSAFRETVQQQAKTESRTEEKRGLASYGCSRERQNTLGVLGAANIAEFINISRAIDPLVHDEGSLKMICVAGSLSREVSASGELYACSSTEKNDVKNVKNACLSTELGCRILNKI